MSCCDKSIIIFSHVNPDGDTLGSMLALRNPKAHENIGLDKDEAFRRLMFASMLMYKIDEGVAYSQIEE